MDQITQRLEALFGERNELIDRYAELWARHGGGSRTWEDELLELETNETQVQVRARLAQKGITKEAEFKEALRREPAYRKAVDAVIRDRTEWAKVREEWTTLTWRIQLEMAKLRLELGEEATPTALADDSGALDGNTAQVEA